MKHDAAAAADPPAEPIALPPGALSLGLVSLPKEISSAVVALLATVQLGLLCTQP